MINLEARSKKIPTQDLLLRYNKASIESRRAVVDSIFQGGSRERRPSREGTKRSRSRGAAKRSGSNPRVKGSLKKSNTAANERHFLASEGSAD